MPNKLVYVQRGADGRPIRIFRTKEWRELPEEQVGTMLRHIAVEAIRWQVFERSHVLREGFYGDHACERCGRSISWTCMEMHETIPKGKGGCVSLENCEALCHDCHTGSPDSAHGNRRWQTSKIKSEG